MNTKLRDAARLVKSKVYILVTDEEAVMNGDFRGFDNFLKLHSLQSLHANTEKLIAEILKQIKGTGKKRKPTAKKSKVMPKTSKPKPRTSASSKSKSK